MAVTLETPWTLQRGETIRRKDLHDAYGGIRQGGVAPSTNTPNVFLFTDPRANKEHGYVADRWTAADLFEYCGEGQVGDQSIRRYNWSIATHAEVGKALRLFEGWRGEVRYAGEFRVDELESFYYTRGKGKNAIDRRVVMFRLRPVGFVGPGVDAPEAPLDKGATAFVEPFEGDPYRLADESKMTTTDRVPFTVDPDEQDRALQAHAAAQNLVADWVRGRGRVPLSPKASEPSFDLAWREGGQTFVVEVKSVLPQNEVRQLRLGLGQVLDYAHQLSATPVLFVDRRPTSDRWLEITASAGVRLAWPASLGALAL